MRAECAQNAGCPSDAAQAEQADRAEPHQHHRPEDVADERGSLALDQKQANQGLKLDAPQLAPAVVPISIAMPSTALSTEIAGVTPPP